MTETPGRSGTIAAAPPTGQPVSTRSPRPSVGRRDRPWWGLGDVVLAVPVILSATVLGLLLGVPFADGDRSDLLADGAELPLVLLATSLFGQQAAQAAWPFVVSWWKGAGAVRDWRLTFKPIDLAIGFGTAIIAVAGAAITAAIMAGLLDLADPSEADNRQFLRDADGSGWVWFFVYAVVVLAPIAEELFFRGLTLRAFEKRAGSVVAVIGSTVVFTLPHFSGGGPAATAVLFASIGVVGLVLGTVTVVVGRLWPAVFAHMIFNALGAAGALGAFDRLSGS